LKRARLRSAVDGATVLRSRTPLEVRAHGERVPVKRPEPEVTVFEATAGGAYTVGPR
jgi:hypothetical protein